MKRRLIWWLKIIKQYLGNCGIHGVKYLVDDQFSYVERLFWLVSCALCWWGCASTITEVIDNYLHYSVAVTAETMYVDWETPFPAIIFCITTTSALKSKYFKQNPGTFSNYSYASALDASSEDLLNSYKEVEVPCTEFLHRCIWNNVEFDCCNEFRPLVKSGIGHCFAMNTFHNGRSNVRFFMNRTVKYGDLAIDIIVNKATKSFFPKTFEAMLLNNLQLPILSTIGENEVIKLKVDRMTRIEFTIHDTFNEDGVKYVPIERRGCRFMHEPTASGLFDIYTRDTCNLEIIVQRMIDLCGCINFYYYTPPGAKVCNVSEMQCLLNKKLAIINKSTKEECIPNCEGTSLNINRFDPMKEESPGPNFSRVHFTLLAHPTVRYRRYVVNDLLSITVSVGSAVGLFMGASILSIFEIPYWLFVRRDRIS